METASPSDSIIHPRREHAIHNQKACDLLAKQSDMGDWVITTAFYSALHWLEYRIFPFRFAHFGTNHEAIDMADYSSWYYRTVGELSKHGLRLELARKYCNAIAKRYEGLYDTCMGARYYNYNYNVTPQMVRKARKNLEQIRLYCDQSKS